MKLFIKLFLLSLPLSFISLSIVAEDLGSPGVFLESSGEGVTDAEYRRNLAERQAREEAIRIRAENAVTNCPPFEPDPSFDLDRNSVPFNYKLGEGVCISRSGTVSGRSIQIVSGQGDGLSLLEEGFIRRRFPGNYSQRYSQRYKTVFVQALGKTYVLALGIGEETFYTSEYSTDPGWIPNWISFANFNEIDRIRVEKDELVIYGSLSDRQFRCVFGKGDCK